MSFLSILKDAGHTLETIAVDIEKGLAIAQPIISAIPGVGTLAGPILAEVEAVITKLTAAGQTLTQAQISAIVQAVAASQGLNQAMTAAVAASAR